MAEPTKLLGPELAAWFKAEGYTVIPLETVTDLRAEVERLTALRRAAEIELGRHLDEETRRRFWERVTERAALRSGVQPGEGQTEQ